MYHILLEEFTSLLPSTPAQNKRVERAVAECGAWKFDDVSELYKESAVRVHVRPGQSYAVFAAGEFGCCTCADFRERAFVKGEIAACKHIIGTYACAQFPVAPDAPAAAVAPAGEDGEGPIDWRNAEPIGAEYISGVGEVPFYSQAVGEGYGLHICNA